MAKHGKKYREVKAKVPTGVQELEPALTFLRENRTAKFDETVELAIRLGIDPKKSENTVRGSVGLPNGTGKALKVLVFASGSAAEAARSEGADFVGMDDMIEKVKEGWTGFDVAIATTEAMKEVRKLGRVLGPRGLMPNPKTGTVSDDPAAAVRASKAGRVEFRMDRQGNINVPAGKISFDIEKLAENIHAILVAIRAEKPAAAKGTYIKMCTVSTTMGVGLRVNLAD